MPVVVTISNRFAEECEIFFSEMAANHKTVYASLYRNIASKINEAITKSMLPDLVELDVTLAMQCAVYLHQEATVRTESNPVLNISYTLWAERMTVAIENACR
ncbi:hypothetical protein ACI2KR_31130 [Pseudomonas luteola]